MQNIMLTQSGHAQAFNLHPIRKNIPPEQSGKIQIDDIETSQESTQITGGKLNKVTTPEI